MINILFIHQSAELYGSDKTLLLLLQKLDKTKYTPVVVLPAQGPLCEALKELGIVVIVAPVLKIYRKMFTPTNLWLFFTQIKQAFDLLDDLHKQYRFDLIYSNTLAVFLGMLYARKRKIKHLWHVHEIIEHPKAAAAIFPKLLDWYADVVVCNSLATRNNLVSRRLQLTDKTTVIHNGVDFEAVATPRASKSDFGFGPQDLILTLVGRISRLKGHKLLIEAYDKYLRDDTRVKLLFVGSPVPGQEYYLQEIEQLIAERQLQDKVKILPFTRSLSRIWDVTDIAISPSTEAESFGLVALEAMLAQLPVIATDLGGFREIIVPDQTGLLFENKNVSALGAQIARLLADEDLRIAFGKAGFERATAAFSLRHYVDRFEKVFDQFDNH